MSAYKIIDHTYDVVVVGAGGAGLRATMGAAETGPEDRLHHQGLPDPQPYRRGAGRHRRQPRQHGPGPLDLAHVRHGQGLRLARRPGRDRIYGPRSPGRGLRARACGRAVQPHRRRQDLPARVRRHDPEHGRGPAGAAHLRRRRPHRPRDAAHALPAEPEVRRRLLHRIFRARPDHGRRRVPRRDRSVHGRWLDPSLPRAGRGARHRRLWPHLFHRDLGPHLHRRRQCDGAARRPAAAGHGVRPVPPDRHLRRRAC